MNVHEQLQLTFENSKTASRSNNEKSHSVERRLTANPARNLTSLENGSENECAHPMIKLSYLSPVKPPRSNNEKSKLSYFEPRKTAKIKNNEKKNRESPKIKTTKITTSWVVGDV